MERKLKTYIFAILFKEEFIKPTLYLYSKICIFLVKRFNKQGTRDNYEFHKAKKTDSMKCKAVSKCSENFRNKQLLAVWRTAPD